MNVYSKSRVHPYALSQKLQNGWASLFVYTPNIPITVHKILNKAYKNFRRNCVFYIKLDKVPESYTDMAFIPTLLSTGHSTDLDR